LSDINVGGTRVLGDDDGMAARLWAMANLGTPMAVRVAATLRIADHIAAGVRTAPELATAVSADPDALDRLLRYLTVRGVLSRDDCGRYSLTAQGEPLRDDHPAGIRLWLDIEGGGRGELSFVKLLHSIRTGKAAFPELYGTGFWNDLEADPARSAAFNKLLGADTAVRAPGIVAGYDWGALEHVVDVGGGDGSLLTAILNANPALRGTVVDLPAAAETARKTFTSAGLAHRADAVVGSFFDPLPPGAGGYVLSLILHDWDDDDSRAILRRCAEAAGEDGGVFVIESIGPEGDSPHTGMDLRMLAVYGAKERGVAELAALGADCGLALAGVHQAGPSAIVELRSA
jgi:O-methyltransferase